MGIEQRRPTRRRRGKAERTSGAWWREDTAKDSSKALVTAALEVGAKYSFCPLPVAQDEPGRAIRVGSQNVRTLKRIASSVSCRRSWRSWGCNWRRYLRSGVSTAWDQSWWIFPAEIHIPDVTITVSGQLPLAVDSILYASDRLMSLRRHSQGALTVVSIYNPTNLRGKTIKYQAQRRNTKTLSNVSLSIL